MKIEIEERQDSRLEALIPQIEPGAEKVRAFTARCDGTPYHAILSRDKIAEGDLRWHLSISGEAVPPWGVIAALTHKLRPGVPFAIGVPPRSWWVNFHPTTIHVFEIQDEALIDQWRNESRGDTPT